MKGGEYHKEIAQFVHAVVKEEDRGLILTTKTDFDTNILLAYLRIATYPIPTDLTPQAIAQMRLDIRKRVFHLWDRTVLIWVDPGVPPAERERLVTMLSAVAPRYGGPDSPLDIYDVTKFIWTND